MKSFCYEEAEYIRQNLDLDNFLLTKPEGRYRIGMGIFDHWDGLQMIRPGSRFLPKPMVFY